MKRVAVTGIGVLSPIGNSLEDIFQNACAGRSGIDLLISPFTNRLRAPLAATVKFDGTEHFETPKLRMLDRVSQLGIVVARRALADSNINLAKIDLNNAGVFFGTGMGGCISNDESYKMLYGEKSDRINPFTVLMGMHNAPAAWIGIEHQFRGPNLTYSTACSSSAVAIGEAWLRIASGSLDIALAGGAEAPLSFGSFKAWEVLNTLATIDDNKPFASCRPFAKNRSGMVLGEGAAMLILEPLETAIERGAFIHGEVTGYGLSTDSSHITRPSAKGQANSMHAALKSAGIGSLDIDAINAHGTGTQINDAVETAAIKAVFGEHAYNIPISATKAIHGHLLGAAGSLECVLSLLAMQKSIAFPTMHLQIPDFDCDLDYVPNVVRENLYIRTMLSNSFAFGGVNVALIVRAFDNEAS